jgi:hypothetical protein
LLKKTFCHVPDRRLGQPRAPLQQRSSSEVRPATLVRPASRAAVMESSHAALIAEPPRNHERMTQPGIEGERARYEP